MNYACLIKEINCLLFIFVGGKPLLFGPISDQSTDITEWFLFLLQIQRPLLHK